MRYALIDLNLAKQVKIHCQDAGYPVENFVSFPTTGALGYGIEDVVFLKTFMTKREDRDGYQKIRSKFWGDIKPASTFLLVSGLAQPAFLLEVEVIAAKPA